DKVDAGTLANLYAAGYLPEIWTPDAATERLRRRVGDRGRGAVLPDRAGAGAGGRADGVRRLGPSPRLPWGTIGPKWRGRRRIAPRGGWSRR
ncbi:hypothetical protein CNY89_10940, partial [Amaricoccus sp. HAR-UPW-R2A-40]